MGLSHLGEVSTTIDVYLIQALDLTRPLLQSPLSLLSFSKPVRRAPLGIGGDLLLCLDFSCCSLASEVLSVCWPVLQAFLG